MNDISDQGYDTDELSDEDYGNENENENENIDFDSDDAIDRNENQDELLGNGNMDVESSSTNHEKDKKRKRRNISHENKDIEGDMGENGRNGDSDIENDIETDELDNLLNEAGVALEPSGCMRVGGRLLRLRADINDMKRFSLLRFCLLILSKF